MTDGNLKGEIFSQTFLGAKLKCLESKELEATKVKDWKEQNCSTSSGSCSEKVHNGVFITLRLYLVENFIYSYE